MHTVGPDRLAQLLQLANEQNWCHRWACTTCGSQEFHGGLQNIVDEMGGGLTGRIVLAKSLVIFPVKLKAALVEDVLVWLAREMSSDDLGRILGTSDAGTLLAYMKNAHEAAQARRHSHNVRNDPAFVAADRAQKKAAKKAAHQERLAAKALRDAIRKGEM